ncbi:MAG TPA: transglycosylase SLT domain-containing protein [Pyrinomonadaceae bacterium]|nr:transglycosylase SLT domain-containing protein [Pyrinomonadaceae bacterium]
MIRLTALSASLVLAYASSVTLSVTRLPVRDVIGTLISSNPPGSQLPVGDEALLGARRADREGRGPDGKLAQLSVAEHQRRAHIYMTNRAFAEAREHWQAIIERYPNDTSAPAALYGMGRSYFQERSYTESLPFFERLARDYATWKEGREGLYSAATALLRLGRASEAAARFREYTERFPQGERIENAYLNVIDSLREAGQPQQAITWIALTREKFAGSVTDTNALFARLRLDVAGGDWQHAIQTCDELRKATFKSGVMTSADEVAYLRAYSLQRAGRTEEAINAYLNIRDNGSSYYGALATTRLLAISSASKRPDVLARVRAASASINTHARQYPAPYRETILRATAGRKVDPRFVLAIIRQESSFRPRARSTAAARGLLQLTIDTAAKYSTRTGLKNLPEDELYRPETSILIGSEYLSELTGLFPDLPEAVAAAYNGGEDNVARWVKRAVHNDAGVFTSEIGFAETKDYVAKVMSNYRAYRQLYTTDLRPR